jgi:hypothetical protein
VAAQLTVVEREPAPILTRPVVQPELDGALVGRPTLFDGEAQGGGRRRAVDVQGGGGRCPASVGVGSGQRRDGPQRPLEEVRPEVHHTVEVARRGLLGGGVGVATGVPVAVHGGHEALDERSGGLETPPLHLSEGPEVGGGIERRRPRRLAARALPAPLVGHGHLRSCLCRHLRGAAPAKAVRYAAAPGRRR